MDALLKTYPQFRHLQNPNTTLYNQRGYWWYYVVNLPEFQRLHRIDVFNDIIVYDYLDNIYDIVYSYYHPISSTINYISYNLYPDISPNDLFLINNEFYDFNIWFHNQNMKVPKVPTEKSLNAVPCINYVYWITLTPKVGINREDLGTFVIGLKKTIPKILGCFEIGSSDNYHAHFVIELDKSIDTSKSPFISYTKNMGIIKNKTNMWRINNMNALLIKLRYMFKEDKNNHGYYGDYEYWNNMIVHALEQEIINEQRLNEVRLKWIN